MRRPIHVILDWDGTLTRKDTLSLVGQIAYHANASKNLPPWSDFVNGYMNDYTEHTSNYRPPTFERKTLPQEREWLASLTPIENKSVKRVETSGIFKGTKPSLVDHIAASSVKNGDLQLRPHWDTLFQSLLSNSINKISILSVNWSARFIRQSILSAISTSSIPEQEKLSSYIKTMNINANEISNLGSPSGSDGKLSGPASGIRTSADKLFHMPTHCQRNLETSTTSRTSGDEQEHVVVYIGDSATDLEALLAADVGICMRDEAMGSSQQELADTLQRIGVDVRNINQGVDIQGLHKVVYWTEGFKRVVAALERL